MTDTPAVKVFSFNGIQLRVIVEDGKIWLSGRDIMRGIGYSASPPVTEFKKLPEHMRCLITLKFGTCVQAVRFLSEDGAYTFLDKVKGKKPQAEPFKMWLVNEVIPAVKDSGASTAHLQEEKKMTDTPAVNVFSFNGIQLRSTTDDNGVAWFVAKDIATGLGYSEGTISNMEKATAHVPAIWKGRKRIPTVNRGEQEMICLTEQGVYFFLGRSDKPLAVEYQMWIAGEVMPSIRKHGMYATPAKVSDILANPDAFIEVLQQYKAEREKRIAAESEKTALEAKITEDKPKVIFAEALETSKSSILIGDFAKILRQNGINIGQNRLFVLLREEGYLIKRKGESWNMPTQEALDRGLFEVKTRVIYDARGSTMTKRTTKITGKGQIFFVNYFKNL